MNLILILKELWRRRLLVALAIFAAAAISLVAVFQVSVSPPSVSKRSHVDAEGQIELLVDSARSPLADARRDLTGLTARAGVFARLMTGGNVINRIARANGIPVKQIETAGQATLPGQVPGAEEAPQNPLPYGIAVTQTESLPIVTVLTRAPTVPMARSMAAAAPAAISREVESIQEQQGTPPSKRVEFRVLGPAEAALADDAKGKKIALMLFFVVLAILILLILGLPRLVIAWRAVEPEVHPGSPEGEPQQSDLEVLHLPATHGGNPEGEDHEAARIGQRDT